MNTHGAKIHFGRYKGERITRLPHDYLKWAVSRGVDRPVNIDGQEHRFSEVAEAELKRRGERITGISLSAHAVDRFSLRHLKIWKEHREENEGLYGFLERVAFEALSKADLSVKQKSSVTLTWDRVKLVFDLRYAIPVLKTVK